MDKAALDKLMHVIDCLESVDGQLTNFKARASKAAAQAVARFKLQGSDIPSFKPLAEALVKLGKAEPTATKAVDGIKKIGAVAADKKKGAALTLDDAKKQARAFLPKIQAVDDIVGTISTLEQKVYREIGTKFLGLDVDLNVTVSKNCPFFTQYYAHFKVELNKLK
jgi:hypothetical protein